MENADPQSLAAAMAAQMTAKKRRPKQAGPPVRPICAECGKDFSNQSALSKHKLTHSDERRFSCNLCGKSFKRQDHLNGHMLTHRDKKPYGCDVEGCEKTYCDARSLRRHKENHHSAMSLISQPQPPHLNRTQLAAHPQFNLAFLATQPPLVNRIQYAPPVQAHSQQQPNGLGLGTPPQQLGQRQQPQQAPSIVNCAPNQRSQNQVPANTLTPNIIASVSNQQRSQLLGGPIGNGIGSIGPSQSVRSLASNGGVVVENGPAAAATHLQYLALSQHNQQPSSNLITAAVGQQKLISAGAGNSTVDSQLHHGSHLNTTSSHHLTVPVAHRPMSQQPRGANDGLQNNLLHQLLTNQIAAGHSPARGSSPAMDYQQQLRQRDNSPNIDPSYHNQIRTNGRMSQSPEEQAYQKYSEMRLAPPQHGPVPTSPCTPCTPIDPGQNPVFFSQHQQQAEPQTPTLQPPQKEWPLMTISYDNNNNQAHATDRHHVRFEQPQTIQNYNQQQQQHGQYCDNSYPNTPQAPVSAPPLMSPHHQGVPNGGHFGQQVAQRRASHPGHSLPCTPTAPQTFTFSTQHLQQYHQEQSMVNGCHADSTPPTPNTAPGSHPYNQPQQYDPEPSPHYAQASPYEASPLPQQQQPQQTQQVAISQQNGQQFMGSYSTQEEFQDALDIEALSSVVEVLEQQQQQQAAAAITTMAAPVDQSQFYEPISAQNTPNPNLLPPPQSSSLYGTRPQHQTSLGSGTIQQAPSRPMPVIHHDGSNTHNSTVQQSLLQNLHHQMTASPPNGLHAAVTTKLQALAVQQQNEQQLQQVPTTMVNTQTIKRSPMLDTNNDVNIIHHDSANMLPGNSEQQTIYYQENRSMPLNNNVIQQTSSVGSRSQPSILQPQQQQAQLAAQYRPVAIESISSVEDNGGQMHEQQPSQRSTLRSSSPNLVMNLSPEPELDQEVGESAADAAPDRADNGLVEASHRPSKLPIAGKGIAQKRHLDMEEDDDDVFVTPPVANHAVAQSSSVPLVHPPTLPRLSRASLLPNDSGSKLNSSQSPKRMKHKPEPLYIPPHVNAFGYQSRLRSPRLWDGNVLHSKALAESRGDFSHDKADGHKLNQKISPPPYTPPPMLSPSRTASGLYYWHIISGHSSGQPKPAAFTFGQPRRQSSQISLNAESKEEMVPTPTTAYEFEPQFDQIPETDIQPHVNVGSAYQARIPAYIANQLESMKKYKSDKADMLWDPKVLDNDWLPEELEAYLNVACTACVPGAGRNKEYAYHVLYEAKGDLNEALRLMLEPRPTLHKDHPLVGYQYPETNSWSLEQIEQYHRALVKCDKDFNAVAKEIGTKTVKQCIEFYYLWKKVCPDDYKRLRIIRRKREQSGYYFRSDPDPEPEPIANGHSNEADNGDNSSDEEMNDCGSSVQGGTSDREAASPAPSSVGSSTHAEYPCRVCGKVFNKVKSRSAHMKIHGQGAK